MAVSTSRTNQSFEENKGAHDKAVGYQMGLPKDPGDNERVHGDLFAHALQPRAGQVKDVLLEKGFKGTMIGEDGEKGKATQVERALLDCPFDSQTL